jgi:hypothetical protein
MKTFDNDDYVASEHRAETTQKAKHIAEDLLVDRCAQEVDELEKMIAEFGAIIGGKIVKSPICTDSTSLFLPNN